MIIAGNSHVSVFRNRLWKRKSNDPVKVKWVGAITAGHFVKNYSSTQVVRSIFFKTDDWKILSIGMHDMFLLCRAYSENRYEQIFDELISCYKKIFFELNAKGKFGWLISPQQLNGSVIYGIPGKRVFEFSQEFNEKLTDWCVEKGIVVINPLSKILGKNYLPKNELLQIDGIHLNDTAIKYYINEINKKTGESLIFVPRAQSLENVLQAGTEPESLSLLVADELGLLWDQTKLPHGTRRQLEDKLIHFISDRLSESGNGISLERDTDYNYHNKLRSIDLVEIYTFASELFGEEINFDVNIRELNTVEKLSDFIYKNKPLTKNDFFESLTQDTSDNIRSSETFFADSRIAALHDAMYMHFKEIIHLQTEGVNFGYGIIYFWFALIEAKRDNYGLALNLLQNAEDINLRFTFRSLRTESYRNLWEEKLVEQQKELNKKQAKKQNRTRKKYEYSDLWWPEGKFVQDEDELLLELNYRGKEITAKVEILYAVGVYDLKKCRLYFDIFKRLKKIYLFMPVPEVYEQLKKSVHNDARIEVFPYALTDTDGYDLLVMDIIDSRLSLHMGKQYNLISGKAISVECRTFEKFIESNEIPLPDMLIFDIRGMEHRFYSSISPKYLSKIKINYFTTSKEAFCYGERSNILFQRLFKEHFEYFGFAPFIKSAEQKGNVLFLNTHDINSILDLHEKQTKILEKEISSSVLKIKYNVVVDECIDTDISHEGMVSDFPEEIYQNIQSMVDSGHLEKAFAALEKLIEEFSDYALAHNDLGVMNYNRGDKEKALKHYEKAARLEPENIIFQKNLADFYYIELGRVEEAMQIYVKVLNNNPEDVETLLIMGHICVALKKFDDAKDFYSRILITEPWNKDAKQFLEELEKCQLSVAGDRLSSEDVKTASKEYIVSAIVSTYNSERFIRGCLEDLESQTIADRLEIIVVNSGSQQKEEAVIKEFQKKYSNIKYIKTDKRETVYAAWNRGIKVATGKYITNANTDDRHRKDAFEVIIDILETHPEMALVYADVIITETENETFENCTPVGYFGWMNWKREDLLNKGCFMGPQPMWRRDVHDEYGYFDDSFVTSGDYEFWLRISQTNTFLHLPVRLGLYLRSPGSIEHSNREKQREENNRIFKMYSEYYSSDKIIRRIEDDLSQASAIKIDKRRESKLKAINTDINVSIIIPTSGQQNYIKKCVESIKKHTPQHHEIMFVNNGAAKGTTKWLKQCLRENSNYHMVKCPKDTGSAGIVNEGIKASTGEYILLLSNDAVVTKDWLGGMLECLQSIPDAGVAGPMSNNSRGAQKVSTTENISIVQLDKIAESFMTKNRYRRISSNSIDGFCMLFARDLVEKIGFFDEQFGHDGYEDEDFCLRAVLEGRINLIAGDVYVHRQNKKAVVLNKKFFNEKWNNADSHNLLGKKFYALKEIEKGREAYQRGNIDGAVELFLEGIRLLPDDKWPYYAFAEMLLQAKNCKDAIDILNEIPQDEQDIRRIELLGYCKECMDLDQEALGHADHALSINGNSAAALNLKGLLAYKQKEIRFAEDYFKKAMEADPGYGEPYTNLGAILWDNTPEDALDMFERGFFLSPTIPDIVTNYHSATTASGEYERAGQVFEEAGLLYPNSKMIKYQFIDMLIKQGKNTEAMHQIEEAIALFGADDGILPAALKIRKLLGPTEINKVTKKKSTVSLCMIVKNEEKYLAKCLRSIKPIVDEMIVVDTGSTDMTKDIAKVFGAKVYDFKWNDDFSEARNFSISKASGKWNLIMDADEAISSLDYNKFKTIIEKSKSVAYQFTTRNYTLLFNMLGWNANDEKYINENAGAGWTPSDKVRLFPNKPGIRFEYPIHELIEPSLKKTGFEVEKCKIPIHHYGRLNQGESDKKGEIYYQIGRKKLDKMEGNATALIELAIQAGILGKYDESIELWERFINLKPEIPIAFVNMGAIYTKLGKYDKALSAAAKALEIDPDMKEAHYNFAFSKVHLGQVKEAISVLEKLLSRFSEYPPAQFLLSVAYCLETRKAKWRKGFENLRLTMGAGLAVACHEFAKGLVSAQRPDYAVTLLEAAIESKNKNKEIDELYSKCLEMMNVDRKTGTSD